MTRTKATERRRSGPKSGYDPVIVPLAHKLALLGATDDQIGDVLGVTRETLRRWQSAHPALRTAIQAGKAEADAKVAHSLYRRAVGFRRKSEKIFCGKDGVVTRAACVDYYPPDTTACIFWLKNRRPEQWRDTAKPVAGEAGAQGLPLYIDPAFLRMAGAPA